MATATLNPVLESISGTVGGIVLYKRCGRTIMRAHIIPPNPRTPAQQANRSRFRDAMLSWRQLPDEEKDSFNRAARRLGMTGHNLFISRYMKGAIDDTEQIEAAGKSLTAGRDDEVSLIRSSHNPVRRQADTDRASVRAVRSIATSASFDRSLSWRLNDRLFFALFCGETKKGTPRPCSGSSPSLPGMPGAGSPSLHPAFRSVTAPSEQARRVFLHAAGRS